MAAQPKLEFFSYEDWQPIASAPKDDAQPILGWIPSYFQGRGGVAVILWQNGKWWDNKAFETTPTHWIPLPLPPLGHGELKCDGDWTGTKQRDDLKTCPFCNTKAVQQVRLANSDTGMQFRIGCGNPFCGVEPNTPPSAALRNAEQAWQDREPAAVIDPDQHLKRPVSCVSCGWRGVSGELIARDKLRCPKCDGADINYVIAAAPVGRQ